MDGATQLEGNVRELRNFVERLRIHYPGREVFTRADAEALPDDGHRRSSSRLAAISVVSSALESQPASNDPVSSVGSGNPQMAREHFIRGCFIEHRRLTRKQVMELSGGVPGHGNQIPPILADEGVIRKVMPTKAPITHYFELVEE